MFTVPAMQTYGMRSAPTRWISASSASRSTLPLNGLSSVGSWASFQVPSSNLDGAARQLLVQARGGEVHVARHVVAGLDQDARQQVLGAAALVGRDDVAVAVVLLDRRFEVVEVAAAGIGLVAHHHAGPLPVAHRAGAAVGQQVDVDVLGAQQEGVVARLGDGPRAFGAGHHLDGLDHLDLPGFGPRAVRRTAMTGFGRVGHDDANSSGRAESGKDVAPARVEEAVHVRILVDQSSVALATLTTFQLKLSIAI